jgi:hypothetical protein
MSRRDEAREVLRELLHEALAGGNGNGHTGSSPPAGDGTPPVPAPPVAAVFRPSSWNRPPAPGEIIGDRPAAHAPEDLAGDRPPSSPPPSMPGFAPPAPPLAARGEKRGTPPAGHGERRGTPPAGHGKKRGTPPAGHGARPVPAPAPRGESAADRGVEWVTLDSDADLARFVRSLLARFENPRDRTAIKTGRLRFALRRGSAAPGATAQLRIERGAVTERTIKEAAAAGARVVLAPAAVITPLAKEKARALGVEIEREKPC